MGSRPQYKHPTKVRRLLDIAAEWRLMPYRWSCAGLPAKLVAAEISAYRCSSSAARCIAVNPPGV